MSRRLGVLGSTGSVGRQTLDVVRRFPNAFDVVALSTHTSVQRLQQQAREFDPDALAVTHPEVSAPEGTWSGSDALQRMAEMELDCLVLAVVGVAGLEPCLTALDRGTTVALANKEVLVTAGELVRSRTESGEGRLLPVDSEHSGLFQLLRGEDPASVKRVVLTASGGPFRDRDRGELDRVTPEEALDHPNWDMGPKITVDSATLMNKGLEVIEACHLLGLEPGQVEALIHPQSAVHALVEYRDHSTVAQCGTPDMKLPIQYALFYPERREAVIAPLSLDEPFSWDFEPIDTDRFPAYGLARRALEEGGSYPAALNAANEEVVGAFLEGRIAFTDIPTYLRRCLEAHRDQGGRDLDGLLEADRWARRHVRGTLARAS